MERYIIYGVCIKKCCVIFVLLEKKHEAHTLTRAYRQADKKVSKPNVRSIVLFLNNNTMSLPILHLFIYNI